MTTPVDRIGEMAGLIWRFLNQHGEANMVGIPKKLKAPRDLVMQAIGWLAREDKVEIRETGRTKTISLKTYG